MSNWKCYVGGILATLIKEFKYFGWLRNGVHLIRCQDWKAEVEKLCCLETGVCFRSIRVWAKVYEPQPYWPFGPDNSFFLGAGGDVVLGIICLAASLVSTH